MYLTSLITRGSQPGLSGVTYTEIDSSLRSEMLPTISPLTAKSLKSKGNQIVNVSGVTWANKNRIARAMKAWHGQEKTKTTETVTYSSIVQTLVVRQRGGPATRLVVAGKKKSFRASLSSKKPTQ